jgi:ankyrin repeat protein
MFTATNAGEHTFAPSDVLNHLLQDGWLTPLHLAAKNGRMTIVSLLLERGANIHAKDEVGVRSIDF